MRKAILGAIFAGLQLSGVCFAAPVEEPLVEILPQVESACTSALVQRTLLLLEVGHQIAQKKGLGRDAVMAMEEAVKSSTAELVSAVGAITGAALYHRPGLPAVPKDGVITLLKVCKGMLDEVDELGSALRAAEEEGLYEVHLSGNADLAEHVRVLEQFVMVKQAERVLSHSTFEPITKSLLPVEELGPQLKKPSKGL